MSHHILCNFTFWQKCHLKKAFALLCCIFCCHACSIPGINKVSVAISSVSSHTVKLALRFTIAIELVHTYLHTTISTLYYILLAGLSNWESPKTRRQWFTTFWQSFNCFCLTAHDLTKYGGDRRLKSELKCRSVSRRADLYLSRLGWAGPVGQWP